MSFQSGNKNNNTTTTSTRSRRPFMRLDSQNVVQHQLQQQQQKQQQLWHQQCYKLVPDLSPEYKDNNENNETFIPLNSIMEKSYNHHRRRRLLPQIPTDQKPFSKLWNQEEVNSSSLANNNNNRNKTLRWTRKLSTNMLLEIETDANNGKALSLKLVENNKNGDNDDNYDDDRSIAQRYPPPPPPSHHHQTSMYPNITTSAVASDSGVSSNLESLINSPNSDTANCSIDDYYDYDYDHYYDTATVEIDHTNGTTKTADTEVEIDTDKDKDIDSIKKKEKKSDDDHDDANGKAMLHEASHRALYKFCARHSDEIDLQIGDPIYVIVEHEDQWSEGINLRTGAQGIFPSSLTTDVDYNEFTTTTTAATTLNQCCFFPFNTFLPSFPSSFASPAASFNRIKRERFLLNFLASIEVNECKGDDAVLCEIINRVSAKIGDDDCDGSKSGNIDDDADHVPCQCILEISDIGVRMMDNDASKSLLKHKDTPTVTATATTTKRHHHQRVDYFFSLLQITYFGYHQLKHAATTATDDDDQYYYYFAFITRHPTNKTRFACHVFRGAEQNTTREVAEAVGRAFNRFYNRFVKI